MRRDRLVAVDLARTVALCGMVVFHFTFDLELFGHLPQGTTVTGGWAVFSRVVAGSFLFLSGVSLILAHGDALQDGPRARVVGVVGHRSGHDDAGVEEDPPVQDVAARVRAVRGSRRWLRAPRARR